MPALMLAVMGGVPVLAEEQPTRLPRRQGPFALCRAQELGAGAVSERVEWLSRFRVLITNGYGTPSAAVRRRLARSGTQLLRYFWLNGFPAGELHQDLGDGNWREELLTRCPEGFLNAKPQPGPPGTPDSYYFDLADPELLALLVRAITESRSRGGYAGTFFDYAGEYALPEEIKALYRQRHPDRPYDHAVLEFLRALRECDPRGLVATNQAFRSTQPLASAVDYDLAESYGASFAWGPTTRLDGREVAETYVRPWAGPSGLKELYGALTDGLRAARPRHAILCLDYMRTTLAEGVETVDLEAVYYSYAAAAVWGLPSFCSGWYGQEYRGPLYFLDLGEALGDAPQETGSLVCREYTRGLVALQAGPAPGAATVRLRRMRTGALLDLLTGRRAPVVDGEVRLELGPAAYPVSGAPRPVARVYAKEHP